MWQDFFSLYIVYFISVLLIEANWNRERKLWMSLFVHTPWCKRYTCSANTQSVQLSVLRFTRNQVLVSMTTNTIDFIFRIFKLNKNIYFLILAIHLAQDQIILALLATDEVVAALYWVATRQEKARPSPESVGSITSRYSGNDPTLHSRRGGTRQTQESGGKFGPIKSVQNVA